MVWAASGVRGASGILRAMKRAAVITYLIALHTLVGVALITPGHLRQFRKQENPHIAEMRVVHGRMAPTIPDGAAIFLGDSITEGLAVAAVSPHAVNLGIGGLRTDQLLENLPAYPLDRARAIYLMIGINDFGQGRAEGIQDRIAAIAASLPDRPVVWTGVMPVREDVASLASVATVNEAVERACAALPACRYIDPAPLLAPGGKWDQSAYLDAVHLNAEGYRRWVIALRGDHSPPPA